MRKIKWDVDEGTYDMDEVWKSVKGEAGRNMIVEAQRSFSRIKE
jgi:hypothetical protein